MFPSIVVSGGVHSKNLRKGDGECLRASVAISTLSTSEGRGKKQGGSCSKDQWVTFPISFSQLPIVNTIAVHASAQNSNDTAIADVGTTGFHEYSYNNGYWLAVGH